MLPLELGGGKNPEIHMWLAWQNPSRIQERYDSNTLIKESNEHLNLKAESWYFHEPDFPKKETSIMHIHASRGDMRKIHGDFEPRVNCT